VLGTLDAQERANAQSLLRTDHGFIAMVRIWERRFGELHLMVEPVEPDAKILQRIKAKIAEIAGERAPDGKPPTEGTASLELPAATGLPAEAEMPKPSDAQAAGEAAGPQDAPAIGTTPQPAEPSAAAEAVAPAETAPEPAATPPGPAATAPAAVVPAASLPPAGNLPAAAPPAALATADPAAVVPAAAEIPAATETRPGPESPPLEPEAKPEHGPIATVPTPPPPPSLKLPDRPADRVQDQRSARRAEITIDVIRSRRRWRMLGVCMSLLVIGWVALLAAWRFAPDRLPPRLRPAELMMWVGIEAVPRPAPAVKRAPPESQFDE
jgi:hypothetical protein